jgi:ElaB/YqjD/DUF883 family membrane-anchored ribosome-binding protein
MAEPLSDWKDREFAPSELPPDGELTYPAPAGTLPPTLPGMAPEHQLEADASGPSRLNAAAETIGGAVGSAVGSMRRLPENMKSKLRVVGGRSAATTSQIAEQAGDKLGELKETVGERLGEWKETAGTTGTEWREIARDQIAQWSAISKKEILHARRQAAYYTDEYPIRTILAFGAFAFVIGCALRMWRANSD